MFVGSSPALGKMNIREHFPPIGQFTLQDFIDQSQVATSALIDRESSDCVSV